MSRGMEAYRIADEPKPGTMQHLTVNPIWPLLGIMFGGAWLSWPWSVFNGIAMGSPTLRKEVGLAVLGFIGSAVIVGVTVVMLSMNILTKDTVDYALLALTVWKLGISYWLFVTQNTGFQIYEYFGGIARNGFFVVMLAFLIGRRVLPMIQEQVGPLLTLVVR